MLSCKKSFHGGGGTTPTPSTSRFPRVSEASKVTQILSDFVTWQENCSVTSEKRFLSDGVIPWLCLHTSINLVSNFDLIYQLWYILLGINDIYEDLWKEYLSQKWLMKLSLLIGVMNCFNPLYSTVCHNTIELFLSLMKLWKLRPLFPYWNDCSFDMIS